MAGKPRLGLDYFFVSVDFYSDIKIRHLKRIHGSYGIHAYIFLEQLIFRSGSYLKFDLDDLVFELSDELQIDEPKAAEILNYLVKTNLFDKASFDKGYLTSVEIQEHYYFATKERKVRTQPECWLLSEEKMKEIDSGIKRKKLISGREDNISPG